MSYAAKLWRSYQKGRETLGEICESMIHGVEHSDFEHEIDSMPSDMLLAFAAYVAPTGSDESGPLWENISVSQIEMHAFDFDLEKACQWKLDRVRRLNLLCRRKLSGGRDAGSL